MKTKYIRGLDDRYDKALFFISVFGGIALILAIRLAGDAIFGPKTDGFSFTVFVSVLVAMGVIAAYTIFVWQSRARTALSIDRASDNAYYIGLLFTLVSLGYSLIKLSAVAGGTVEQGSLIISLLPDFGLALGSTIAGIFARIILQQLRGDPDDVETEAREELGKSALALRTSIGTIVADLNVLSDQISISLSELSTNVTKVIEDTARVNDETNQNIAKNFDKINEKSEAQMQLIYNSSSNVIAQLEGLVTKIQGEFAGLGDAPKKLETSVKAVSNNLDVLSESTSGIVSAQTDLLVQTRTLANDFEQLNKSIDPQILVRLSESTLANLSKLNEDTVTAMSNAESMAEIGRDIEENKEQTVNALNTYVEALGKAVTVLNDFVTGKSRS